MICPHDETEFRGEKKRAARLQKDMETPQVPIAKRKEKSEKALLLSTIPTVRVTLQKSKLWRQ